jgi:hypothetical protein
MRSSVSGVSNMTSKRLYVPGRDDHGRRMSVKSTVQLANHLAQREQLKRFGASPLLTAGSIESRAASSVYPARLAITRTSPKSSD